LILSQSERSQNSYNKDDHYTEHDVADIHNDCRTFSLDISTHGHLLHDLNVEQLTNFIPNFNPTLTLNVDLSKFLGFK